MEGGHLHIIYVQCTFSGARSCVCDSLSPFFIYAHGHRCVLSYIYMPVTVCHDVYAVEIRARVSWEGFVEEVSFAGSSKGM